MVMIECLKCSEITLRLVHTTSDARRKYETWECTDCGHVEVFRVPKRNRLDKYPGWSQFLKKVGGLQTLDKLSRTDAMKLAFLGGRAYEAKIELERLKSASGTDYDEMPR